MKPVQHCVTVLLALAVLGAAQPLLRIDATDPARNLAPVRLFVSTRAGSVDVTVANASVASYRSSIVSGREGVRSSQTGQTLRISGNIAGELAEAQFDLILADVPDSGAVGWQVSAERSAQTVLDVQVPRDPGRPQSIDRFTADQARATFSTEGALLQPGTVRVARPPSRLVLAQFYPWYPNLAAWNGRRRPSSAAARLTLAYLAFALVAPVRARFIPVLARVAPQRARLAAERGDAQIPQRERASEIRLPRRTCQPVAVHAECEEARRR